jgi:hypothetical protein
VVGWYGGSEEYALISSLRFSRETLRKQKLSTCPVSFFVELFFFKQISQRREIRGSQVLSSLPNLKETDLPSLWHFNE